MAWHIQFVLNITTCLPLFLLDHLLVFKCFSNDMNCDYCWYCTRQDK